jgi:quaternary ammonium compound-resistance protein SugE
MILIVAGLFEAAWAIGLKHSNGFTKLWPSIATIVSMIASIWLLGLAMKHLSAGTAYSIWVGIGTVGTVIIGIMFFGESASLARLFSVILIVAGIIGLKLTAPV